MNELKFLLGAYGLAESIGMTLLEAPLAALPNGLQRLRVGPLASPGSYSATDWMITNILGTVFVFVFYVVNHKYISLCGWSRDEFPWTAPGYPFGEGCDDQPRTMFHHALRLHKPDESPSASGVFSVVGYFVGLLFATVGVWRLSRKLPGWGEPPASGASASQEGKADEPPAASPAGPAKIAPFPGKDAVEA